MEKHNFLSQYIHPEVLEKIVRELLAFIPRLFIALFLLWLGFSIIKLVLRAFRLALVRRELDVSLQNFLLAICSIVLKILVVVSVASMVGISTTSFVAAIGAAGLAIGMALQGSLSNFAGSVLLMVFKPYKVGDYIRAQGEEGTVKDINIFTTILNTTDNRSVIIPNGPMAGGVIVNFTRENLRRVDIQVGVDYSSDLQKVRDIIINLANADERILKTPEPAFVGLKSFADNALDLQVRLWVKSKDYWAVYFSMMEAIKIKFEQEGISIPFPQREVRVVTSETPLPQSYTNKTL